MLKSSSRLLFFQNPWVYGNVKASFKRGNQTNAPTTPANSLQSEFKPGQRFTSQVSFGNLISIFDRDLKVFGLVFITYKTRHEKQLDIQRENTVLQFLILYRTLYFTEAIARFQFWVNVLLTEEKFVTQVSQTFSSKSRRQVVITKKSAELCFCNQNGVPFKSIILMWP